MLRHVVERMEKRSDKNNLEEIKKRMDKLEREFVQLKHALSV